MEIMLKKSKRVSWAPDEYLCEVKPLLETDTPLRIGTIPSLYGPNPSIFASSFEKYAKVYGNIWKEKKSKKLQSHDEENPVMPPGFENSHNVDGILKWKCPPKAKSDVRDKWKVMAGEESEETKAQNLRETSELEVFHLQSASISHNPHISLDTKSEHYDDRQTPIVPIEEVKDEGDPDLEKPVSTSISAGADHLVAAYVATLTAILKVKNIDTDFLVKILSNPKMIEKLSDVDEVVASSSSESALANAVTALMVAAAPTPISTMPDNLINNAPSAAASSPMFVAKSVTEPVWKEEIAPMSAHRNLSMPNLVPSSNPVPVSTQPNCFTMLQPTFGSMPAEAGPIFSMSSYAAMTTNHTPTKDAHYYHNLIKEYGGNKQEMPKSSVVQPDNNHNQSPKVKKLKPVASKAKCQKPCRFYFGVTGCLNGSKCLYRHDTLPELQAGGKLESPRAKKRKLTKN